MEIKQPTTGGTSSGVNSANALIYTPTGAIPIVNNNAQAAIDYLESQKMPKSIYDPSGQGYVDKAAALVGLVATLTELNFLSGITGSVQSQINAISSGTFFKGEYATRAAMNAAYTAPNPLPQRGYWVFVTADETRSNAKTQYYHDGINWIFGGGVTNIPDSSSTIKGAIRLAGVLVGTADAPQLAASGVTPGTYSNPTVTVGADGRITSAAAGASTVAWTAVSGRPTSAPAALDDAVSKAHLHANQVVLDALSDSGGALLYKGLSPGGTSSGIVALTQITKLGVVGSVATPKEELLSIPLTMDFKRLPVEILKLVPAPQNVISTVMDFNNADSTSFVADPQLLFDGTMHLRTNYVMATVNAGALSDGILYSTVLDKSGLKSVEKVTVT